MCELGVRPRILEGREICQWDEGGGIEPRPAALATDRELRKRLKTVTADPRLAKTWPISTAM
jgi:hypothetical protein